MCKRNFVKRGSQNKIAVTDISPNRKLFVKWFDDFVLAPCALELLDSLSLDLLVYKMLRKKTNALETNEYHGVFLCVGFGSLSSTA